MSITIIIVVITIAVSYLCFQDQQWLNRLKHHPYTEIRHGEYHRLLTSGFVHGDWMHLIFNMYVLYEFGSIVEQLFISIHGTVLGRVLFLLLYIGCLIISDLPTLLKHKDNTAYASIGASGAVAGILFSFVLFDPWSTLLLFFVLPMPAIVLAVLYLVYSSWAEKNQRGRIDHSAHYYGALAGVALTIAFYPPVIEYFIARLQDLPF